MTASTIDKICFRCKTAKPLSEFYLCANKKGVRVPRTYCKDCSNPRYNRRKSAAERFWAKVQKTETCWVWTAARNSDGYGAFGYKGKVKGAHIVSYDMNIGSIPDGLCVLHKCDNPPCVRPDHLFLGTKKDNMDDCVQKDRRINHTGEKNGQSRLTDAQVVEMRARYRSGGATQKALAQEYGVSLFTIYEIVRGLRFKHLL